MRTNGENANVPQVTQGTLKQFLEKYKSRWEGMLPQNTIAIDRFLQAVHFEIIANPTLAQCDTASKIRAIDESARLGIEVGGPLAQGYLIPYNENRFVDGQWQKVMTAHFQLGYRGLIMLARRSNTIKTISAEVVYDNDVFEVELGLVRKITHKIDIRKERGEPIGYYCIVELTNGGVQFGVMSKKDVENHRDKFSKAHKQKKENELSVWDKYFDAMALKTVIIKTLKLCPISVEALEAVQREEQRDNPDIPDSISIDANVNFDEPAPQAQSNETQKLQQLQKIPESKPTVVQPSRNDIPEEMDIF
jgi:recombination protein RecT